MESGKSEGPVVVDVVFSHPYVWKRYIFQFNNNFLRHTMVFNLCIDCNLQKIQKWIFIEFPEYSGDWNGECTKGCLVWCSLAKWQMAWLNEYKIKRGKAKYGLKRLTHLRIPFEPTNDSRARARWHARCPVPPIIIRMRIWRAHTDLTSFLLKKRPKTIVRQQRHIQSQQTQKTLR